jgi:hypothetical protein
MALSAKISMNVMEIIFVHQMQLAQTHPAVTNVNAKQDMKETEKLAHKSHVNN